ncbi:hypothetical protein F4553_004558 [Allocatelliglobosispora scoriae]|uniref:Uncharacterized protein n=1 Tax=Allocatelliglobosispora scoriae TaxID=643052 RepID=A0A841BVJ4_9ACTN|nr:hypothetical protein [Allocatelliglobosispora scoriae]MBB5871179.1 hypothetical protein [Allocatelliglobosispora scoriae]
MAHSLSLRALVLVPVMVVGLSACSPAAETAAPTATPTTSIAPTLGPDVISLAGVRAVRFGQTRDELSDEPGLSEGPGGCGEHIVGVTEVSPVFTDEDAGEKLVLLWANPPLHTPENVAVGTAMDVVKSTYPQATPLTAPTGTYRFDGLLVSKGEFGFLFLHDGKHVQKLIAGYTTYLEQLFAEGFGAC